MNDILFAAFHDELEKLSGLPSYVRKAMKSGKPVGPYAQGLFRKNEAGREISQQVSAMGGPTNAQAAMNRGANPLGGSFSSTGANLSDNLRLNKARAARLKDLAGGKFPQKSPRGDAMRSGQRDLNIGLDRRSLSSAGYYKP
jgi:hypothetical protein